MLKTYCFIYRSLDNADIRKYYVKAEGWVQASSIARKELSLSHNALWYCVPARRNRIQTVYKYAVCPVKRR